MGPQIREKLTAARESLTRPTDRQIVEKLSDAGISHVVSVPCSITAGIQNMWEQQAEQGKLDLINTTHEHNLVGLAAGTYLGTGESTLIHMQNSGLPNAGDGIISFAEVYRIPTLLLVTWRGNTGKDDSEPHQAIGKRTEKLTHAIVGENVFGTRMGRGILQAIDRAVEVMQQGGVAAVRLSPDAFKKSYTPQLPQIADVYSWKEAYERLVQYFDKGTEENPIQPDHRIDRDRALERIVSVHPDAAILFANGYTARAAQAVVDRVGNFYNTGYMGGTLAIGYGMARCNPDIEVVVVDGDQNAMMSNMKDHLKNDYPDNLYWYILDNGIGASVGTARSLPLAADYYELARVIPTTPDAYDSFPHPRVKGVGAYFDTEEAQDMAERIGPLPAHAKRFRQWVEQQTMRSIVVEFAPITPAL